MTMFCPVDTSTENFTLSKAATESKERRLPTVALLCILMLIPSVNCKEPTVEGEAGLRTT
jgi:hypothetical protein